MSTQQTPPPPTQSYGQPYYGMPPMPSLNGELIVVVRGEGCYIWDAEGNRYLDAVSALYCVNIGYGPWPEIAEAAAKQLEELPFFTNWVGFATPPSLELAEKVSE